MIGGRRGRGEEGERGGGGEGRRGRGEEGERRRGGEERRKRGGSLEGDKGSPLLMDTCSLLNHFISFTVICFFLSSKFSAKKYSCKIIFAQTKLNENNFTSRVWWALIEEIISCAEEMACEKEMACCVRGYHVYKDTWAAAIGEALVCSREPSNAEKFLS